MDAYRIRADVWIELSDHSEDSLTTFLHLIRTQGLAGAANWLRQVETKMLRKIAGICAISEKDFKRLPASQVVSFIIEFAQRTFFKGGKLDEVLFQKFCDYHDGNRAQGILNNRIGNFARHRVGNLLLDFLPTFGGIVEETRRNSAGTIKAISFRSAQTGRCAWIHFDRKLSLTGKNHDMLVIVGDDVLDDTRLRAIGEIKGGGDIAGTDEHYKTALGCFRRIDYAYEDREKKPHKYFIGRNITPTIRAEEGRSGCPDLIVDLDDSSEMSQMVRNIIGIVNE